MTDYTKTTDFTSKDSLPSGDSGKIIRGAEFGTEFDNIQTAVNSKSNKENPSFTGNITVTGTVDGRDIAADGTKLDTVETNADVTDTANVTAAGAVMDSELTNIAAVKALNQGVATTDSPTFAAVTSTGNVTVGGTVDGRDVAADGTKLDGIEAGATADQTAAQIKTAYESNANTNAFTDADHTKLDGIEASADVTDATNVTAAGALMDSEVTNLAQVKAFDSADYATAAQGTTADNALPKTGGAMTGAITTNSTFDGRDVATDGAKLDGIEASADVTDTANVTAAGALMDSELTSIASVKALNQGVATTDSPTFAGATVNGTVEFDGLSGTGAVTVTDILDQDNMSSNSATALATQQSIKSYVDSQVATSDTLAEVLANGNATGGTDVAFGDSDKAIFGAGSDLQIYHHPTDGSFIVDNGTGNLQIDASDFRVRKPDGSEAMIHANADGAVKLFYDGGSTPKLATTSTGIDVTGTVTADGLTVDGEGTITNTASTTTLTLAGNTGSVAGLRLQAEEVHADIFGVNEGVNYGGLKIQTNSNGTLKDRLKIESNGDISFYEDTGTTAKFHWDAAAESLGIGTSSPSTPLAVHNALSSGQAIAEFRSTGNSNSTIDLRADGTGDPQILFDLNGASPFALGVDNSDGDKFKISSGYQLGTNDRFVIDSTGRVGIGTSSPSSAAGFDAKLQLEAANPMLVYKETDQSTKWEVGAWGGNYVVYNGNSERMRISSGGNLLVGQTSNSETGTGIGLVPDGTSHMYSASTDALMLGRGGSDGDILSFNKSGTTVGSIGTEGGNLYIDGNAATGKTGIEFLGSAWYPRNDGANSNGAVDLGDGSNRFKDLYLSGTANAGGLSVTLNTDALGKFKDNISEVGSGNFCLQVANSAENALKPLGFRAEDIRFSTGSSENMRLDASGNLLVGASSFSFGGSDDCVQVSGTEGRINIENDTTSTANVIAFYNPNGNVGRINTAGTSTNYLTSSDQRLKNNIVDAPSASDDIDAIQVRSFDWKADGSHQKYGMVAQELQTVAPEAVSAPEDPEEMMGVDYSKLVPMLVKEIQSLRARVAQLETN